MNEETAQLVAGAMFTALAGTEEQLAVHNARLHAQRLLLEALFTSQFEANPAGFSKVMAALIDQKLFHAKQPGPTTDAAVTEHQGRIAAELDQFQTAVASRLAKAPLH